MGRHPTSLGPGDGRGHSSHGLLQDNEVIDLGAERVKVLPLEAPVSKSEEDLHERAWQALCEQCRVHVFVGDIHDMKGLEDVRGLQRRHGADLLWSQWPVGRARKVGLVS